MFAQDLRYIRLSSISAVHLGQKFILLLSVPSVLNMDPPPSSARVNSSIKAQIILKLRSYLSRVYPHCAHKEPRTCRSDITDAEGWGMSHLPCSLEWCRAVLGFRMSHTWREAAGKAHRQRVIRALSRSLSCGALLHASREKGEQFK